MNEEERENLVKKWTDMYASEVLQYASPQEATDEEVFADIYHSLAHSPLAATMIQLEHTHASVVSRYVMQKISKMGVITLKFIDKMSHF